jgi:pseudouridine kinase
VIACIGGIALDLRGTLRVPLVAGASNHGELREDFGGVARNVAQNLARLGCQVALASRVGDDEFGRRMVQHAAGCGIDTSLVTTSPSRTASYTAILDRSGELIVGLDDFDICQEITPEHLEPALPRLREAALWFLDTNLPGPTIEWLLDQAGAIPVAVDAISPARAERLVPLLPRLGYLFCNAAQAAITGPPLTGIVSDGANGITIRAGGAVQYLPALAARVRDVTGAGDALISGTLFGLSLGWNLVEAARLGLAAAAITVESEYAAVPGLTETALRERAGI